MAKLGLSAPWQIYYRELQELFKNNIGIKIVLDEENYEIKMYVSDTDTAAALAKLIPSEKEFGNVTLKVIVIPANGREKAFDAKIEKEIPNKDLMRDAFKDNDAVSYFWYVGDVIPGLDICYVVFINAVVQYYTDTMADPHGLTSTLYENIARNVFGDISGVYFCTDIPED